MREEVSQARAAEPSRERPASLLIRSRLPLAMGCCGQSTHAGSCGICKPTVTKGPRSRWQAVWGRAASATGTADSALQRQRGQGFSSGRPALKAPEPGRGSQTARNQNVPFLKGRERDCPGCPRQAARLPRTGTVYTCILGACCSVLPTIRTRKRFVF